MTLTIEKNEKNIKLREDGKYEFEHILTQALDQTNVNAIVDSNKLQKEQAIDFIANFDKKVEETKKLILDENNSRLKSAKDFLNSITDENKIEIALKNLDEVIAAKQKFIDEFDDVLKKQYDVLDKILLPQKTEQQQKIIDADKTLEVWNKHYKELNEDVDV